MQRRFRIEAFYADPSEPAYIEACRARGLAVRKAENAVLPGITAVSAAIAAGMTVDPSCASLLAELPAYAWKLERGTGEMSDAPTRAHDDACDALRYAVLAHAAPEPTILTLYKRLAVEGEVERTEQVGSAAPAPRECGQRFRTSTPAIALCALPAGHAGPHAEEAGA